MLEKLLKKIGVNSYLDLNEEEKRVYAEWSSALEGRPVSSEDVQKWLQYEYETAVSRITEEGLNDKVLMFRQIELKFIKKILSFINSPKVGKEYAQKALEQLIEQK